MGSVVVGATMSLDGFIAGRDEDMDWVFDLSPRPQGRDEVEEELIATTGAVLAGRRSHDVGERSSRAETSGVFGGRWSGPEFVLTHRPPRREASHITFLSGDIRTAAETALEAAGAKNLLVIGADVTRQCLDEGLVHEIRVYVAPVLLGEGVRLFSGTRAQRIALETVSVRRWGALMLAHYRVLG
jgi:dihydrofolate reductase